LYLAGLGGLIRDCASGLTDFDNEIKTTTDQKSSGTKRIHITLLRYRGFKFLLSFSYLKNFEMKTVDDGNGLIAMESVC
jgi:hypothetical protein